jgi:amidase
MNSAFDVVLCAVAPVAAFRHDMSKCWSYTAIWNLLDYPAISFPSGLHCDPERDLKYTDYTPRNNEFDAWNLSTYEPKLYADAPIALQLVGKKYDDEKVVAALHLIKNILDI